MKRGSSKKKPGKSKNLLKKSEKAWIWTGIILLGFALVMSFSLLVYLKGRPEIKSHQPPAGKVAKKQVKSKKVKKTLPKKPKSKIAIVIDDLGYDENFSQGLLSIDAAITFSILPFSPHAKSIAEAAHTKGKVVMLHLPMEPNNNNHQLKIDNSYILISMDKEEMVKKITASLNSIPYVSGVNNHTGSKFTADKPSMTILLKILKQKNLFFLDSRTTPDTIAFTLAGEMGVKTAERDVFLDNIEDVGTIKAKIDELVKTALLDGFAIGIGHPHPSTLKALKEVIPKLGARGVKIVPITDLLN